MVGWDRTWIILASIISNVKIYYFEFDNFVYIKLYPYALIEIARIPIRIIRTDQFNVRKGYWLIYKESFMKFRVLHIRKGKITPKITGCTDFYLYIDYISPHSLLRPRHHLWFHLNKHLHYEMEWKLQISVRNMHLSLYHYYFQVSKCYKFSILPYWHKRPVACGGQEQLPMMHVPPLKHGVSNEQTKLWYGDTKWIL